MITNVTHMLLVRFALAMLLAALGLGVLSSFAFLQPELFNRFLPFQQLRPMHVSAALFWIISGAVSGILVFREDVFRNSPEAPRLERTFVLLWVFTIVLVFVFYALRQFGGREYWEFPPFLCVPILIAWLCLLCSYFTTWAKRMKNPPLYVWMWTTGIVAFLATFLEQNLYHIPWFRESYLREVTVQWKSNGAMVGAWNQMIYGTSLYVMARISGNASIARGRKAFFFYFLGLTNLMFNWGHHIYNLPTNSWIRHVSYTISMTEWLILISILQTFKNKLTQDKKYRHLLSYRFLIASEYWVGLNLLLALMMSIPAINRYTHGTHITVAHAMGATIGINTMILFATLGYILQIDKLPARNKRFIRFGFATTQASLLVFWLALITAGIIKGYRDVALNISSFQEMMRPVMKVLYVFALSGIFLVIGMATIAVQYLIATGQKPQNDLIEAQARIKLPTIENSDTNAPSSNGDLPSHSFGASERFYDHSK